jgi:hypothetical protein
VTTRAPRLRLHELEDRTVPAAGDVEWLRQFGGAAPGQFDVCRAVDAAGNVYVAGQVRGALPGQTYAGFDDVFVRKYDAAGTELWTRQFGTDSVFGTFGGDEANSIAVDATGVYVVGTTAGALPGQTNAGTMDAFVRKYDLDGTELWTRQFGTAGGDDGNGVAADGSGVYVAGRAGGALPGQAFGGVTDSYLRKYDPNGTELWTRQFGTTLADEATTVAVHASTVYVGGTTNWIGPGDVFLRRYDAGGGLTWARQFGSNQHDTATDLAVGDAGVYVAGIANDALPGQTGAPFQPDSFVRKYDPAGTELWTRQFSAFTNASRVADSAHGVAVDASGVYLAGFAGGTLPGQTSLGSPDAYLRKYDHSGAELWTRQFGTAGGDSVAGVAADANGVYVVGHTTGTLPGQTVTAVNAYVRKYDPDGGEVWHRQFVSGVPATDIARALDADGNVYVAGQIGGTPNYPGDAFVSKYTPAGDLLWLRQFGGAVFSFTPAEDAANGLAVDASGVYVVGSTSGRLPGQTSPSPGLSDAFVRKYDPDGNELWTRQFGTGFAESAVAVAADGFGGVYVAGNTDGRIPNQSGGFEPSAGGIDVFVRKYDSAGTALWTRQFG